jgi:hypothetical protein
MKHLPLLHADLALAQLRSNRRLAQDWQLVSPGQFEHGARLMDEVGRLLGAWLARCAGAATWSTFATRPPTFRNATRT